ncbi:MAG TPA: hypothetical protein VIG92_00700, partial [Rhodospirillales bacterium]
MAFAGVVPKALYRVRQTPHHAAHRLTDPMPENSPMSCRFLSHVMGFVLGAMIAGAATPADAQSKPSQPMSPADRKAIEDVV